MIVALLLVSCAGEGSDSLLACSRASVVYGDDDRHEVKDAGEPWRSLSELAVALIARSRYETLAQSNVDLRTHAASAALGLCPNERFADQPALAECSGILLEPDLVLTTAHCLPHGRCDESVFVTRFANLDEEGFTSLDPSTAFRCVQTEAWSSEDDFALVRLSSSAVASVRLGVHRGTPSPGDAVVHLGHPSGLPLKVHDGATVVSVSPPNHFGTDLDSFSGGSGGPIFTSDGTLIGMMLEGQMDYVYDAVNRCSRPMVATARAELGKFERAITLQAVLEAACADRVESGCRILAGASEPPASVGCPVSE